MLLGDAVGLGKTIQAILAYARSLEKYPELRLVIVCPTTLIYQWKSEIKKFTDGIEVCVVTSKKPPKQRMFDYSLFEKNYHVLIISYGLLVNDLEYLIKFENFMIVFDEITQLKTGSMQKVTKLVKGEKVRAVSASRRHLAGLRMVMKAKKVVGLSATVVKNRIMELWSIFNIIQPGLFPDENKFKNRYCTFEEKFIWTKWGRTRIKEISGYKNITHLRQTIEPFYLGRRKSEVALELPKIINREIFVDMEGKQLKIYEQAFNGFVDTFEGERKELNSLSKLLYCQLISDSTEIMEEPVKAKSAKVDELIRLLTEELSDEKIIIFSKFERLVSHVEKILQKKKINVLRITGKESQEARETNKIKFQTKDDQNIIFITTAGGEGINLQAASVVLFFDLPFSAGDYIQVVGRAHRIGSKHDSLMILHLMSRGTTDEHVLNILRNKIGLIEKIFDEQEGMLKFGQDDLMKELRARL